jgi:hypothetical protein
MSVKPRWLTSRLERNSETPCPVMNGLRTLPENY